MFKKRVFFMCNVKENRSMASCIFAEDNKRVTKSLDIVTDRVVKYMIAKGITVSAAESCTGGLLSEKITSVSGASACYHGGVCSYTEEVKMKVLGVKKETLEKYTVYSAETASEMSRGVRELMQTDCSVGITGIAGPSGGTEEKPVGTVYVSVRYKDREIVRDLRLYDKYEKTDRELIRTASAMCALEMLEELITDGGEAR